MALNADDIGDFSAFEGAVNDLRAAKFYAAKD